jgi:uncharacterized protein (TIGR02246 family)
MMVEDLYRQVIDAWNERDGDAMAELFIVDGEMVGFDGSQHTGRGVIAEQLKAIFASHPTAPYITKITGVTTVTLDVAIVRAIAGMVPVGKTELEPKLHAIQRMTAVQRAGDWRVALFHTTPAQLHGRPDEVDKITAELRAATA